MIPSAFVVSVVLVHNVSEATLLYNSGNYEPLYEAINPARPLLRHSFLILKLRLRSRRQNRIFA
jgi:hypothetical protein